MEVDDEQPSAPEANCGNEHGEFHFSFSAFLSQESGRAEEWVEVVRLVHSDLTGFTGGVHLEGGRNPIWDQASQIARVKQVCRS
jgi:hypothetical protein